MKALIIILVFYSTVGSAQSLISNGDFENGVPMTSLNYHGDLNDSLQDWHSIGTADYYTLSSKGEANALHNLLGFQIPYSGDAYCGLYVGELIYTYLKEPLIIDSTYRFRMYVSLADYAGLSPKEVPICFSEAEAYTIHDISDGVMMFQPVKKLIPAYAETSREKLTDSKEWQLIEFTFQAKGTENILYIGTDIIGMNMSNKSKYMSSYKRLMIPTPDIFVDYAYYYIDNISLEMVYTIDTNGVENKNSFNHITLNNITFETNQYSLTPESMKELDNLYFYLSQNNFNKIMIEGHTDNTGTEANNLALSEKRAMEVKNYLLKKGIDANVISVKGYGSSLPKFPNDSEESRKNNRRIEVKFE